MKNFTESKKDNSNELKNLENTKDSKKEEAEKPKIQSSIADRIKSLNEHPKKDEKEKPKESKQIIKDNEKKKDVHKAPTPTIKDAPIILPKIHKNYIRENRQLVMDNKVPSKNKFVEEKNDVKHKDYGKVPDYIKKYEIEREQQKEEKKKQEEASKYPKGTKLLSEEERVSTLNGLINSKKEMINLLEK